MRSIAPSINVGPELGRNGFLFKPCTREAGRVRNNRTACCDEAACVLRMNCQTLISIASRIRSEWLRALIFFLRSEVVLATVL